jgi:hypothetical protein
VRPRPLAHVPTLWDGGFVWVAYRGGGNYRGAMDRNFAHSDGSVVLTTNLAMFDARTVAVPHKPSWSTDQWGYLPPR